LVIEGGEVGREPSARHAPVSGEVDSPERELGEVGSFDLDVVEQQR
jgi:hypothetical protein